MSDGAIWRYDNLRRPREYMTGLSAGQRVRNGRWVDRDERLFEFLMNGLRLRAGVDVELLEGRAGLSPNLAGPELARAQADGLLEPVGRRIRPTELGRRFLNDLVMRFLPDGEVSG